MPSVSVYDMAMLTSRRFAGKKWRGAMMGAVFAMQGIGQMVAALVMIFLTLGFKNQLKGYPDIAHCTDGCQVAVDKMWRTLIGFGAVPACIALYCKSDTHYISPDFSCHLGIAWQTWHTWQAWHP